MIPKASQRGSGQDLATHLVNTHDNEFMQVAEVRGAVARDLHGAFAEWAAQAAALTRCRNYLYSLSVNPDLAQGPLTRAQYFDYIERVEDRLGLTGQPRAVVFHVKEDGRGRLREHCHVVWSRIDAHRGKAVPLAFDHDKLMMVTRLFAHDHGLALPAGYENGRVGRTGQLSLYEKVQQDQCGLSKEERIALITRLWRQSDSANAFVQALELNGYILATGKRPFVLVDIYGHTNALPKLIDDAQVRTSDLRAFLGTDYAPETLPSVEQAQALAAQHRKAIEDFEKARLAPDELAVLEKRQSVRRKKLEARLAALRWLQHQQRAQLAAEQKAARAVLKAAYLARMKHIRVRRTQRRPQGLAAFLGRVTGATLITKKIRAHRDRKRYGAYLAELTALKDRQRAERGCLVRRQDLQVADVRRRLRGLAQVEKRERRSLDTTLQKQARQRLNVRHGHMPAFIKEPQPRGRKAAPPKAVQRQSSPLARELARVAPDREDRLLIRLAETFRQASGGEGDGDSGDGKSGARQPSPQTGHDGPRGAAQRFAHDFVAAADNGEGEGGGGDGDGGGPDSTTTASNQKKKHRRRQRRRNKPDRKATRPAEGHDQEQRHRRRRKRDLDRD